MAASLELIRQADMVLNACGRPVPPPGYKWIDLPRVIPFFLNLTDAPIGTPTVGRIANTSDTVFICMGVSVPTSIVASFRVRWPDGRYLSQQPGFSGTGVTASAYPLGVAGNMFAFNQPRLIRPDQQFAIEISASVGTSLLPVSFWGKLRYLLKDSESAGAENTTCLVGYPASVEGKTARVDGSRSGSLKMMRNPVQALSALPRLGCGPNQNIMAPEFLLGNQCCMETPPGYEDESFTFASPGIVVPANGTNYGNAVIVPGQDDVVIKAITPFVTYTSPLTSTIPTFSLRLPNGYSVTGGDMVPFNLLPGGGPMFPTLRVRAGDRLIIDMADMQANASSGSSTTVIEFECVKRPALGSAGESMRKSCYDPTARFRPQWPYKTPAGFRDETFIVGPFPLPVSATGVIEQNLPVSMDDDVPFIIRAIQLALPIGTLDGQGTGVLFRIRDGYGNQLSDGLVLGMGNWANMENGLVGFGWVLEPEIEIPAGGVILFDMQAPSNGTPAVVGHAVGPDSIVLTATVFGAAGNGSFSAEFLNPGAPNVPLSVAVVGTEIEVTLATNGASVITSTFGQVQAAINASAAASALAFATVFGTPTDVITAMALTVASGGANGTAVVYQGTLLGVKRFQDCL